MSEYHAYGPRRSSSSTISWPSSDGSSARSTTGVDHHRGTLSRAPHEVLMSVVDQGAPPQFIFPETSVALPHSDEYLGDHARQAGKPRDARRSSFTQSAVATAHTGLEDPHPAGRYSPGPTLPPPPPYSPRRSRSRDQPEGRRSRQHNHQRRFSRHNSANSSLSSGRSAAHEQHSLAHPYGYALSSVPSIPLRDPRRPARPGLPPSRTSDRSSERSSSLSMSELDSNSGWSKVESLSGESDFSTSSKYSGNSFRYEKAFEGGRLEYIRQRSMQRPCAQNEANQGSRTMRIKKLLEDEYRRTKLVKTQETQYSGLTKHVRQKLLLVSSTRGIFDSTAAGRPNDRGRHEQTRRERSFRR